MNEVKAMIESVSGLNISAKVWGDLPKALQEILLENFSAEDRIEDAYAEDGIFYVAVNMGNVGSGTIEWTRKL
jgi:hypothetical protein